MPPFFRRMFARTLASNGIAGWHGPGGALEIFDCALRSSTASLMKSYKPNADRVIWASSLSSPVFLGGLWVPHDRLGPWFRGWVPKRRSRNGVNSPGPAPADAGASPPLPFPRSVRSEIAIARSQGHRALMIAIEASPDLEATFKKWWLQAEQTAERKPAAVRLGSSEPGSCSS